MNKPVPDKEDHLTFRETLATTGHDTLKALIIVSGGAAVAYLAFLGHTFEQPERVQTIGAEAVTRLINAMQWYIYSVAAALLCHGFTYASHSAYHYGHRKYYRNDEKGGKRLDRLGDTLMAIAVLLGLVVLCCFVIGSLEAASGFEQALKHFYPKP